MCGDLVICFMDDQLITNGEGLMVWSFLINLRKLLIRAWCWLIIAMILVKTVNSWQHLISPYSTYWEGKPESEMIKHVECSLYVGDICGCLINSDNWDEYHDHATVYQSLLEECDDLVMSPREFQIQNIFNSWPMGLKLVAATEVKYPLWTWSGKKGNLTRCMGFLM